MTEGYTVEGLKALIFERLAASHLAGREGFGFPDHMKLIGHYIDTLHEPALMEMRCASSSVQARTGCGKFEVIFTFNSASSMCRALDEWTAFNK